MYEMIRDSIVESIENGISSGQSRIKCPECSPDRRKSNERTLSVSSPSEDGAILFYCHHCTASGRVTISDKQDVATPQVAGTSKSSLEPVHIKWLADRGISAAAAERCGVVCGDVYLAKRNASCKCLGFPYINEDGTRAIKWRDSAKNFTQTGAARSLWRIDEFAGGDLIICEGEMDVLALEECGVFSTSVPNGAPAGKVHGDAKKFAYLWDCKDAIDTADRIILAVDADSPGRVLADEIARRVGKARCWKMKYPDDCKDVNDVLIKHGDLSLLKCLGDATPWPISGLRDPSEYKEDAMSLFSSGFQSGARCGVKSIDDLYRVMPQTLTICTGVPGSGKSTFLTWLSVELAKRHGWGCAVMSAETSSQVHLLQLASSYIGKPFRGDSRMTEQELERGIEWASERYVFIDESDTDIQSILDRAHAAVLRLGIRLLVIDPYNFLTGNFGQDDTGITHINKLLVALKGFAVERGIAVWLVAHPTKMYRQSDGSVPVPGGYDISGSAAFFNVADIGLTVSRLEQSRTKLTCWKARFPWVGTTGECIVDFDESSNGFKEISFGWSESGRQDIEFD